MPSCSRRSRRAVPRPAAAAAASASAAAAAAAAAATAADFSTEGGGARVDVFVRKRPMLPHEEARGI